MPDKVLLPDTVTIYNALGGSDSGKGYQRTVLRNVRVERNSALLTRNCDPSPKAKIYLFYSCILSGRTFASPERWEAAPDKSLYYTVRTGRDYIVPGECPVKDPSQSAESMRISVARNYACGGFEYTVLTCN